MAVCPACNSKKGKRKCLLVNGFVCSMCCGGTRKEDVCAGCGFYQKPKRRYADAPAFTTGEMEDDPELGDHGNVIEGALCAYDVKNARFLRDEQAIRIIELLIDKYHFGDDEFDCDDEVILNGVNSVEEAMKSDMPEIDKEVLVKILAVIRFVAKRRTRTGREYMDVIHTYVGQRVATGVRVMDGSMR